MSSSDRQHPPLANINQFSPMRPSDINDASRPPAPEKGTRLRPAENVAPCPLPTDAHTATPAPSPSASPSVPSSTPTPSFPFVPDSTSSSRCTCRDVPPSPSFVKRFEEVLRRFEELYPGEKLDDATTSDQCKDSCIRCALERAKNNSSLQTPQIPSENTNPPKNTNNPMSVSETADTCGVSPVESALTVPSPEKKSDSVPTSPTPLEEPKPPTHPLDKDDPSPLPSRESDPRIETNLTPVKPDPPPLPHAACPHSERTNRLPTYDKTMSPLPPSIFDNPASSLPPSIFYNPASSLPPSIPDNRAVSPLPPIPANPPPSLRSSLSDNATPLLTYRKNNTRGPSFAEHLECLLKRLYSVSPRPGEKDSDTTFPPGNANPSPEQSAASSRLDSTTCLPKSDNTAPSLHASIPGTTAPIRASISIPSLSSSIPGTTPSLPSSIPSSTHSICSCKDITRDQSFEEQLDVSIKRSSTIYPHSEVKGIHSSTSDSSEKSFFWPGLKLLTPQVCPHRDDTSSSPGLTSPKTIHPEDTNTSGPLSDLPPPSGNNTSSVCIIHPSGKTDTSSAPALDSSRLPNTSLETASRAPLFDLYPYLTVEPSFFPIASSDSSGATCSVTHLVDGTPSLPASLDTDGTPSASLKPHMLEKSTSTPLFDLYPSLAVDPSFFLIASSDSSVATCSVPPLVDGTPSLPASLDTDGTPSASLKPHMLEKSTSTSLFDLYPSLAVDPSFFPITSSDSSVATCSVPPLVDGTPSLTASLDTDGTPSASLKPHMLEKSTSTSLFDLFPPLVVDPSFFPTMSSVPSVATCSVSPLVDGTPSLPASLDTDGTPSAPLKPHMLQKSTSTSLFDLYPSLAVDPSFFPIASSDSSGATCSVTHLVDGSPSLPASLDTDGTPSSSLKPHMLQKSTSTSLFDLYPSLAVDPSFFPITSSDSSVATCSVPPLVDGTPSLTASLDTDGTPSASLKPHMLEKSTSTSLFDLFPPLAVDPSFFPTISSVPSVATCSVSPLVGGTPSLPASLDTDGTPSASLKPHILEKSASTSLFDLYPSLAVDPSFFPITSSDSSVATCSVPPLVEGTPSLPASLDTDGTPSASLKPHILEKSASTSLFDLYSPLAVDPSFFPIASSDSSVATCSVPPLVDGTPSLPASLETDGTPSASLKPHMLEKSASTSLFDLYSPLAVDPSFFPIASSDSSVATCSVPPLVDGTPSLPPSLDTDGTPSASLKPHMLQKSTSTHLLDLYSSLAVNPSFFPITLSDSSSATCSVPLLVDGTPSLPASLDTDGTPASLKPHLLEKSTSTHLLDLYSSLAVDPSFFPVASSDSSGATCSVTHLVDGTPSLPASLDTDGTPASLKPHLLEKSTSTPLFDLYPSLAVDPSFFPIASSDSSVATCSVPPLVDGTSPLPAFLETDGTPSASLKPHMLEKSTSTHLLDLYSSLAVDPSFFPIGSSDSSSATCSVPSLVDGTSSLPASLDTDGTPSASLKPHMLQKSTSTHLLDLYSSLAVDPSFVPTVSSDSRVATCSVPPLVDGTPSLPASLDTDGTPSASLKPHMLEKSTSTSLFDLYSSLALDPSFFPIASSDSRGPTCSDPPLVDGTPTLPESMGTDVAPSASFKPNVLETGSHFHPSENINSSEYRHICPHRLKYLHVWRPPSRRPAPHLHEWSTFIVVVPVSDTDIPNLWVPAPSVTDRLASPSEDASVCFLTITDSSVPPLLDVTIPAPLGVDGNLFDHHRGISDTFSTPVVDTNVSPCTTSYIDLTTPAPAATDIYAHSSKIIALAPVPSRTTTPIVDSSASASLFRKDASSSPPSVYTDVARPPEVTTPIVESCASTSRLSVDTDFYRPPEVTTPIVESSAFTSRLSVDTDFYRPPEVTTPIVESCASTSHLSVDTDFYRPPEVTIPIVESCASTSRLSVDTDFYRPPEVTIPIVESCASTSRLSVDTDFYRPPEVTSPIVESSASSSPPSVYTDFARPPEATTPIVESGASSSPPSVYTDFAPPPEATTPIVESGASSSPLSVDTDCTLLSGSTLQESGFLLPSTMDMNPSVPHLEKVHSCAAPSIEYKNICFPLKKYQHLWSTLEGIPTSLLSQRIADMSLPGCTDHSAPPFMSPDLPPQLLGKSESVLVPSGMPDYSSSTIEKAYVSISQQHDLPVLLSEETSLPISGTETTKPSIPRPETIEVLMSRLDKAVSSFSTTEKTNLPPFFQEETSHSISGEEKTDFPVSTEKMDPSAHPSENSVLSMPTLKKMDSPACFLETEKCDASPSTPVKETLFVKVELSLSATEKIDLSISSPVKSDLSLSCPVKSNLIVISSVKTEVSVETGIPVVSPENNKLAVELPVESGAQDVSPVKTDLFAPFLMETDVQDVSPVATDDLVVSPGGKMLSFGSALESDAQDISPVKTDLSDTSLLQSNTQDVSPVKTKLSINSPVKTDIQDVFPEKSDLPVASPMAPDVPVVSPEKNNISVAFVEESDIHDDLSVVPSGKNEIQAVNQVNRSVTFDTDILTLSYERDSEARAPCSSCGHSQPVVSCGNISPSVPSLWDDDESCESSQRNLNSSICPNYACTCAASPSDLVPSVFMPGNTPPTVSSSSCSFSHGVSTNNLTSSFSSLRKIEPLAYSLEGYDVGVCFGGSSCSVCPKNIDPSVSTHRSNVTCSSSSFRKAKPLAYSLEGYDEGVCFGGSSCSVCPKNVSTSVSTHGNNATCSWSSFRKAKPLAYSLEGNEEGVRFGGTSCSVCPKNLDSSVSTHGSNATCSWSSFRKAEPLAYSLEGNDEGVCFGGTSCSICPKNIDSSVSTHGSNATCSWSSFRKAKPLAYSLEGNEEGVCFRETSHSVCPKNIDSSVSTHGSNATCSWSSFRKAKPLAYSLEGNDEGVCFGGTSCSICPKNIDSSVSTHGSNATCSWSSFRKAKPLAYSLEGNEEGVCFGESSCSVCPKNIDSSVSTHGSNATCSWSSFRKAKPLAYSLEGDDEGVCFRGTSCSVCPKNIDSSVSTHGSNATCSWSSFRKAKPLAYSPEGTDEGVCFGESSHSDCPKNVSTSVSTHGNNATCSWSLFRKTEPLAYSLQSDDENVCFKGTKCSVCPKTFASSVSTHGKSNFYSSSLQTTELPMFSSRDASPCSICDTKVAPPASPPESTGPWANYLDDMKTVTSSYGGTLCPKHTASSASHLGRTDPCSPSLEIRDFSTSSSSGDVSRHCTYKRHISPSASGASSLEQTALFSSSLFDSCSCTLPSKNISSAFSSPGKSCSCSRYTSTSDPYALSTEKTYTSELCPIRTYLYLFRSMKYEP
ncbi:serine-rich adhesin for platelets-like [Pleurodeles waltl]|uniref:serine-rich adhesin for platelets-like n=1 Tax=Pleurodeles waltl TaxID=8319 RepID=UPI0037095078